ncbi:hypothetical protein OC834_006602, partial [Tilletia horrida]
MLLRRTPATAPLLRPHPHPHPHPPCIITTRPYAQPAASSPPPTKDRTAWTPPAPALATANTLTLFSPDPAALLIALRSTLTGMLDIAARTSPSHQHSHSHVLLYALSKSLPHDILHHALAILNHHHHQQASSSSSPLLTRIGTLSTSIPLGLLPPQQQQQQQQQHADSSTNTDPNQPLHAVALSLLPASHATPFRSQLRGKPKIQVGRWMQHKERSNASPPAAAAAAELELNPISSDAPSWKDLWGRENASGALPDAIAHIPASAHLATLLFSDPAPQGILEGLDAHFPHSSLLGLIAPPTPFESAGQHDQTLLFSSSPAAAAGAAAAAAAEEKEGPADTFAKGAVGVVLHHPLEQIQADAQQQRRPALDRPFPDGLVPLIPQHTRPSSSSSSSHTQSTAHAERRRRHAITRARGNIISQLNGANAAQAFLADLHARRTTTTSTDEKAKEEEEEEEEGEAALTDREMARGAKKEEEFFVGVFRDARASGLGPGEDVEEPLLLAPLLSGAPSRGTLSLDTEVDLGPGPGVFTQPGQEEHGGDTGLYAQ